MATDSVYRVKTGRGFADHRFDDEARIASSLDGELRHCSPLSFAGHPTAEPEDGDQDGQTHEHRQVTECGNRRTRSVVAPALPDWRHFRLDLRRDDCCCHRPRRRHPAPADGGRDRHAELHRSPPDPLHRLPATLGWCQAFSPWSPTSLSIRPSRTWTRVSRLWVRWSGAAPGRSAWPSRPRPPERPRWFISVTSSWPLPIPPDAQSLRRPPRR